MYIITESVVIKRINLYTGKGGEFKYEQHKLFNDKYITSTEAKQEYMKYQNVMPANSIWNKKHTDFVFNNLTKPLISGTPRPIKIKRVPNK